MIGAAVFRERVPEPARGWFDRQPPVARERGDESSRAEPERRAQGAADSAPPASKAAPASPAVQQDRDAFARQEKKLGTGHGEREYSPTGQTAFERASTQPAEVVQVRYDSYANLLAGGVIARPRPVPRQPDAFPWFVPDPG